MRNNTNFNDIPTNICQYQQNLPTKHETKGTPGQHCWLLVMESHCIDQDENHQIGNANTSWVKRAGKTTFGVFSLSIICWHESVIDDISVS